MTNAPADDDAALTASIERALAPYRDLLRPDELEDLRAVMTEVLATHPVAVRAFAPLRGRAQVLSSGSVAVDGAAAPGELDAHKKTSGERR